MSILISFLLDLFLGRAIFRSAFLRLRFVDIHTIFSLWLLFLRLGVAICPFLCSFFGWISFTSGLFLLSDCTDLSISASIGCGLRV